MIRANWIRFYFLVGIFPYLSSYAHSQSQEIDSLKTVLSTVKTEKERQTIKMQLAKAFTFQDPKQAIGLATESYEYFNKNNSLSECVNNLNTIGISHAISGDFKASEKAFLERLDKSRELGDSNSVAGSFSSLGNLYHSDNRYAKSIACYRKAVNIFKKTGSKEGLATAYGNLGNAYKAQGDYQKALDTYFESLRLLEKLNQSGGTILSNIGNIFADMNNIPKAKIYFNKAIKVFEEEKNDYYLSWAYNNLASVLFDNYEIDEAEKYYFKALKIHLEQDDLEGQAHIDHTFGNIAFSRKQYEKADSLYLLSVVKYEKLGLNYELGKAYIDLGRLHIVLDNRTKASFYFDKAFEYIDFFPYDFELAELYKVKSEAAKWKGDFKSAIEFHEMHTEIRDSVYKMETTREFAEKEAKYQNEKKQKEIERLKHEKNLEKLKGEEQKARENMIILFSLIGGVLMLVIVIVLIRSNRMKLKNNKILQSQNDEISHQKEIIEEKNKDITDSINYAQNIQQAILPDLATATNILGESFILFLPRDIVSGDFYWMHKMENGDVFFAVADCTGHGVPGAFMSMMGNDMLNKIIVDHGISEPGKILSELNKEVKKALAKNISADKMRDGMDIMLCKLNSNRNLLHYAAAMRSMYLIHDNELTELKGDKNPIGGNTENDFSFETFSMKLQTGNCLYLTTDGFADQFGGAEGKKFMSKNMKELFKLHQQKPMVEQLTILKEQFKKWKGSYEQIDDVTVMGIRV